MGVMMRLRGRMRAAHDYRVKIQRTRSSSDKNIYSCTSGPNLDSPLLLYLKKIEKIETTCQKMTCSQNSHAMSKLISKSVSLDNSLIFLGPHIKKQK